MRITDVRVSRREGQPEERLELDRERIAEVVRFARTEIAERQRAEEELRTLDRIVESRHQRRNGPSGSVAVQADQNRPGSVDRRAADVQ